MKHEAIYSLYPSVVSISGDTAYDSNGAEVSWEASAVATKQAELENEAKLGELRNERNRRLAQTDYWMFSDTTTATQAQLDYRQALRDITSTYTSLDTVVWPTKP